MPQHLCVLQHHYLAALRQGSPSVKSSSTSPSRVSCCAERYIYWRDLMVSSTRSSRRFAVCTSSDLESQCITKQCTNLRLIIDWTNSFKLLYIGAAWNG